MDSVPRPICWIICTMDTKGQEGQFLREAMCSLGIDARIVDVGIRSRDSEAAVSSQQVAKAGGICLGAIQNTASRMEALTAMAAGLKRVLLQKYAEQQLDGVVSLGGSGGTTLASEAMCALPVGVPKLMVSTVVSGDIRPYIRGKDIIALNPVADLAGLNSLTRQALYSAARIMYGQLTVPAWRDDDVRPAVAVTSFGSTEGCVSRCAAVLAEEGFETTAFHARGVSGGDIMEELIRENRFQAVLDITTTEVTDLVAGGVYPCSRSRFEAAADMGLPFVLAPGAIDMINLTLQAATPEFCRGRLCVQHSGNTILVRSSREENRKAAQFIAEKLNRADAATYRVLIPEKGFSSYDVPGGAFYDPEIDGVFIRTLKSAAAYPENIIQLPLHLNDPEFAQCAAKTLMALRNG